MDRHLISALNHVRRWYGNVPDIETQPSSFAHFAARSAALAAQIHSAPMVLTKNYMAYTDGRQIFIPVSYLHWDLYAKVGVDSQWRSYAALACINGSQIHEALHLVHTMGAINLVDYVKLARDPEAARLLEKYGRYFLTVINVVEDVYIEGQCRQQTAGLHAFIAAKNEVLLGTFSYAEALSRLTEIPGMEAAIGFISHVKNDRLDPSNPNWGAFAPVVELIDELRHVGPIAQADRLAVAIKVMQALEEPGDTDSGEPLAQQRQQVSQAMADYEATPGPGETLEEYEPEYNNPIMRQLTGREEADDQVQELLAELNESQDLGEIAHAFIQAVIDSARDDAIKRQLESTLSQIDGSIAKVEFIDAIHMELGNLVVEDDEGFQRLGTHLRYLRQERHAPGVPRTSGSRLVKTRLARIATDGKVMAELDAKRVSRGQPEVIILIDSSGSMKATSGTRRGESLFHSVTRAAMGAFESLMRSRVPVSVYAHTSHETTDAPLVVAVSAYEMPLTSTHVVTTTNYKERFARLLTISSSQNLDGFAIRFCAERFTSRPGSKVLIVLSDGRPSGSGYYGQSAVDHTKAEVARVTKAGVHVMSLSLVAHVVPDNDNIYGKEANLPAYGSLLEPTLKRLVQRLATS